MLIVPKKWISKNILTVLMCENDSSLTSSANTLNLNSSYKKERKKTRFLKSKFETTIESHNSQKKTAANENKGWNPRSCRRLRFRCGSTSVLQRLASFLFETLQMWEVGCGCRDWGCQEQDEISKLKETIETSYFWRWLLRASAGIFSNVGPIYNTLCFFRPSEACPGTERNVLTGFFRPSATHILKL